MINKDSCNPRRSEFVENLIREIQSVSHYNKHGISRENVGVIVTYILQKFSRMKDAEGIEVIDQILTYAINERSGGKQI